jgi:hypothetical protein
MEPMTAVSSARRDPEHCKSCPDWNDRAGRCRVPVRDRKKLCGSDAIRYEGRRERMEFDLYSA